MEYNSFYGGRRGASFVIAKRYSTIAEMVAAFSQGGDYKTVNYDEYVLIDTENKNNPDNGKIYRRGYEYNNSMGGAIYEGQIVGPAGLAPHTEMHTIDEVEQIQEREDFTYRRGSGEYGPVDGNIVPGKYIEAGSGVIKYNDKITWAYCSVRDMNSHESTAHIGFKFPYTVIDYTTTSVSTYRNGNYADTSAAIRTDDGAHPFYEKWNISVPKGIKGNSIENIELAEATNDIENYSEKADDIANHRKVLTYEERNYDNKEIGEITKKYIGKINEVQETVIDSRYHLLVYYSDPAVRAALINKATYDNRNDWADLGYIGNGTGVGAIAGEENDSGVASVAATMPPYSAWLIVEDDGEPGSI